MKNSIDPYCISRQETDTRIDNWKSGTHSISPSSQPNGIPLDAFVFSINDFKDFVARVEESSNGNITGVVCHLGIKYDADNNPLPCLVFEAVDNYNQADGNPGTRQSVLPPYGDPNGTPTTACYDFSFPCPPTCPR